MIIKNAKVFDEHFHFTQKDIRIRDGLFADLPTAGASETFARSLSGASAETGSADSEEVIDASGLYLIPGLTDIHFHGCVGYDFCDGTEEAIQAIADYQAANGVTSIVPATMTYGEEKLTQIAEAARAHRNGRGADLCGINMEGPFISAEKMGAQNPKYIRTPSIEMFDRIQRASGGLVKLVDIAPESEHAMEFIEAEKNRAVISVAHTAASYETACEAFSKGASHVTHLYNAMPPFSHRAPGVVGAAFDHKQVRVELICDGVHIHPSMVRATFQLFGDHRVVLISDSMMAAGLEDGDYSLGGQAVKVKGPVATLASGTIAGSVTNLMNCMRHAVLHMGIPLESAVRAAAVNPAQAVGIFDRYGSIETGKVGNAVLLDERLNVVQVILRGEILKRPLHR